MKGPAFINSAAQGKEKCSHVDLQKDDRLGVNRLYMPTA